MYQILIKRRLRNQFDRLNVGDYESVLRGVHDHVHHRFAASTHSEENAIAKKHSGEGVFGFAVYFFAAEEMMTELSESCVAQSFPR